MVQFVPVEERRTRPTVSLAGSEAGLSTPETPVRPTFAAVEQEEQEPLGVGGAVSGGLQTLLTLGSGAVAEPIAGLAGLSRGLVGGLTGEEDILLNMTETIEDVRGSLTIPPLTESGQRVAQTVAVPFEMYFSEVKEKGREDLERTGSPLLATGTQTAGELIPGAVGLRGLPGVTRGARREALRFAREEDINIGRRGEPLREDVAEAGRRRADPERGRAVEDVQQKVETARREARRTVTRLWEETRAKRAGLPAPAAAEFSDLARRAMADFDVEDLPRVQRRLQELDELRELPNDSTVKIRRIVDYRKRLNRGIRKTADEEEKQALRVLKGELDTFMESKFNADMISGDRSVIAKWREANEATEQYKRQFKDDKVIAQFARQDATPAEIRQWIFGASAVGAKPQAERTIRSLKEIVGAKSPEFIALRSDALFDVMRPIFRSDDPTSPSALRGVVRNIDDLLQKNKRVAEELLGDDVIDELRQYRRFIVAARKRGDPPNFDNLMSRGMSVLAVGHDLSQKAFARLGLQKVMQRVGEARNRERFLRELFGSSANNPFFGRVMKAESVAQAGQELEQGPRGSPL